MPTKTYIPQAVDDAQKLSRYFGRWQAKMMVGATTEQIAALTDLAACIVTFLQKWTKPPVNP